MLGFCEQNKSYQIPYFIPRRRQYLSPFTRPSPLSDPCSLFQDGTPGPEPAGSEGAKFRLWVKSKGLTLSRGPGEARTQSEAGETEDTSLYLPTGTEQVHPETNSDELSLILRVVRRPQVHFIDSG